MAVSNSMFREEERSVERAIRELREIFQRSPAAVPQLPADRDGGDGLLRRDLPPVRAGPAQQDHGQDQLLQEEGRRPGETTPRTPDSPQQLPSLTNHQDGARLVGNIFPDLILIMFSLIFNAIQ